MRKTTVSSLVKKEREIQSALSSYWLACVIFGSLTAVRLPYLLAFTELNSLLWIVLDIFLTLCVFGLFFMSVKGLLIVRELKQGIKDNPDKYLQAKVPKPAFIPTLFPY